MRKRRLIATLIAAFVLFAAIGAETIAMPFKPAAASDGTNVKVTSKALKKAKANPNIELLFNGTQLDKNGFVVKGKSEGETVKVLYVPLDSFAEIASASVSEKKKKFTISALNITVTFKQGKNGYTFSDGEDKYTLNYGKSCKVGNTVYVPVTVISQALSMIGLDLQGEVVGKKYDCNISMFNIGNDDIILGGFEKADSPVVPDELAEAVKNIMITGVDITPVAVISKQVVAGMNYVLLCRAKMVVPDAKEVYAFATVYVDLQGNAELSDYGLTDVETNINDLPGGWRQPDSVEMTDLYKSYFDKAVSELDGVVYTPVALLATQVVAGANACVLCESKVVYPGAETKYAFVYIFVDLKGNVEITNIVPVEKE